MVTALEQLGYKPYHMREVHLDKSKIPAWNEALRHKVAGRQVPREMLDRLLKDYDVSIYFRKHEVITSYYGDGRNTIVMLQAYQYEFVFA